MNENQWKTFFGYLARIIALPNMSSQEKRDEVKAKAMEYGEEVSLDEFLSWFSGQ